GGGGAIGNRRGDDAAVAREDAAAVRIRAAAAIAVAVEGGRRAAVPVRGERIAARDAVVGYDAAVREIGRLGEPGSAGRAAILLFADWQDISGGGRAASSR